MPTVTLEKIKSRLWPHQVRAVEMVRRYLTAYKTQSVMRSSLVRFPTGTGKTAVIAVAARMLAPPGIVIVVCPSVALRDQLVDEIHSTFWVEKLGTAPPQSRLTVEKFVPSALSDVLQKVEQRNAVLVGTAQALSEIYRNRETTSDFNNLVKRAVLLLFDEGHHEPAREWGKASRALECPTVLFSATPYRNDYALFEIDPIYVETLSFQDALDDKCIRSVDVHTITFEDEKGLVDALLELLKERPADERAIIRCDSKDSIMKIVKALAVHGCDAIGIHDRFQCTDEPMFRNSVPKPKDVSARIWVHQQKLLEGIDDPRFSVVAIYEPFRNARALVQQVGRVIRNPRRERGLPAVLMVREGDGQRKFWERYLQFELSYDPKRHDVRDLVREAVKNQASYRYIDGAFREVFDPNANGFEAQLRVPRSANIYKLEGRWDPKKLLCGIIDEWEKADRIRLNDAIPSENTLVVLYANARNSPLLLDAYYLEDRLGFTVVHRRGNLLFYYDSGAALSECVQDVARAMGGRDMHHLFGTETRPVTMSMRNTDLGRHAFRHRSVRAFSLADTAMSLSDHSYFCATAEGYTASAGSPHDIRRYIGVARGRVSETTPPNHGLAGFETWAAEKEALLARPRKMHTVFGRFAAHTDPPDDPTPRHLLLDLIDVVDRGSYRTVADDRKLEIEDLAVSVTEGKCMVIANGRSYELTVTYHRNRYRIASPSLDQAYLLRDSSGRFRRGLVAHLNIEQAFRIVPQAGWTIYAHGYFVKPVTGVGKSPKESLDLLRLITEVPALATMVTEKGEGGSASPETGWAENCVFGIIDRARSRTTCSGAAMELQRAMDGFSIVVCDDMHRETADFICADVVARRVVAIHAKHKDSKWSASAFHDVCSQAVKNLGLLQPYADVTPPNQKRWGGLWRAQHDKELIGEVSRIRAGGSPEECWSKLRELIRQPETQREVWIVLGKTFEIAWLKGQRTKKSPDPEAVQLFYLLQSTWAAVSSIGARLRIFAS